MARIYKARANNKVRLDNLLWYLRFAKSRTRAQTMVKNGHIRVNRQRMTKSHFTIKAGDIVTIPLGKTVKTFEITALPPRRGAAQEAQNYYRLITELSVGNIPVQATPESRPIHSPPLACGNLVQDKAGS